MKKYFTILTLAILCCDIHSQHEYKISIGTAISGDMDYSNGIIDGSINIFDSIPSSNSYSNRIGLDLNLEYSYYIKYNLKVSVNSGYSQMGYRSSQNEYYAGSGLSYASDNKINIDCVDLGIGMTFITKQGITFTAGYSAYIIENPTISQDGTLIYPTSPSNNESIDQTLTFNQFQQEFDYSDTALPIGFSIARENFAPFFGIGYEWGDFSIDCNYVKLSNYASDDPYFMGFNEPTSYFDLSSLSLCIGYSKIIKSKK